MDIRHILYHILALVVCAIWATTFVSTKTLLMAGLQPSDIFFYRFTLAYFCILTLSWRQIWSDNWRDELKMVILGITGGSMYFLTENMALQYTYASNVCILVGTCPILTAILLALRYPDERIGRVQIMGMTIAFIGAILVILNGQIVLHVNIRGDLLALAAAFSWAIYSLVIKPILSRYSAIFITRKVFGYGILTILPYTLWLQPLATDTNLLFRPEVLGTLLYLGTIASFTCFLLWNRIIRALGAVRTTNYAYVQPAITLVFAHLVLSERITTMAVAGIIIITIGMIIMQKKKS